MIPTCRVMGSRPQQEFVDPRTGTAYSKARTEMVGLDDSLRKTGLTTVHSGEPQHIDYYEIAGNRILNT